MKLDITQLYSQLFYLYVNLESYRVVSLFFPSKNIIFIAYLFTFDGSLEAIKHEIESLSLAGVYIFCFVNYIIKIFSYVRPGWRDLPIVAKQRNAKNAKLNTGQNTTYKIC